MKKQKNSKYDREIRNRILTHHMNSITKEDIILFIQKIKEVYQSEYDGDEVTLDCIKDATILCGLPSASDEYGAICIGKLKNKSGYVVALGGTDLINTEENLGIKEDLLSAFNKDNDYKKNAIKAIIETIPNGEDIYIYGLSLGGMVLQQVIADIDIKKNYSIKVAVAIGSPITDVNRQKIIFIEDATDVVPTLSVKSLLFSKIYINYDTHINRDGGYKTFIGAHVLSYADSDVWNDIDIFGIINGANSLIIDLNNFVSFKG